jgi:hypothetical protein|tara:strand:+ start:111 stop:644 length:534 start_codon:yes stop_codon:yes gene_type:complete
MPNWCSNQIKLGGPTEEIERIWNTLEDDKQDDGLLSAIAPLDGKWEYEDAVASWGTKWDIKHDHGLQFNKDKNYSEINGYFESAWSPPTEAVRTWLQKNPDCDADLLYCEFSNDFMGTLDDEYEISSTPVSWFLGDETGIALDEAFDIIGMKEELLEEEYEEILNEPLTLLNPEKEV